MTPFDELLSGVYSATVTNAFILVREVRLQIGVLTNFVTVRIYYDGKSAPEPYTWEISASMHPPAPPNPTDAPLRAPTESEALRRAVRTLTEAYEDAVRRGEMPDDGWLVQSRGINR